MKLGLRENWRQFSLLVLINAFVGAMVGLERAILPLIADVEFNTASKTVVLSFLISFGLVKALSNMFAGRLSDTLGRKQVLIAGWLFGLPVPFLIMFAPSWNWVVLANVLLGINQGLCWSTTVIMKIDLVGSKQRGLAMGLNEFAGYLAVSATALATGYIATLYGLRPVPFYPGVVFAVLGLLLSVVFVRETHQHAKLESSLTTLSSHDSDLPFATVFTLTSWRNRSLFAVSQAGLVNNLNDGVVWGLVPIFLASHLPLAEVSVVAAAYPGAWGLCQLFTGALSDKLGRKGMIVAGMWAQALAIAAMVSGRDYATWLIAAVALGVGTAMVYPTLLAAIGDVAHPSWRASAVGVYRLWRDGGYAMGALSAGLLADLFDIGFALTAVAGLTALSGVVVSLVMRETLHRE